MSNPGTDFLKLIETKLNKLRSEKWDIQEEIDQLEILRNRILFPPVHTVLTREQMFIYKLNQSLEDQLFNTNYPSIENLDFKGIQTGRFKVSSSN